MSARHLPLLINEQQGSTRTNKLNTLYKSRVLPCASLNVSSYYIFYYSIIDGSYFFVRNFHISTKLRRVGYLIFMSPHNIVNSKQSELTAEPKVGLPFQVRKV